MKITLVIDSLAAGGAQRQMLLLANGLASLGYEIELIVYHENMQLIDDIHGTAIRVTKVIKNGKIDLLFVCRLVITLRRFQPDIIISFLAGPNFWARLCGRLAGIDYIVTSERNISLVDSKAQIMLEKMMNPLSSKVVANTHAAKFLLNKHVRVPLEKIEVIYNGIDVDKFYPQPADRTDKCRDAYGLLKEDLILVLPARVEEQKNHQCLVKAVSLLNCEALRIQVLFIGNTMDINLKKSIEKQIVDLRLTERIRFCGVESDMPAVYSMADLVVLPSNWEGLPNVVLEAMACETAVIVSDVADNHRIVKDGESGYIFDKNNHQQLAEKILLYTACNDDRRKEMGKLARAKVKELCSINTYVSRYDSLICGLLKKTVSGT